MLNPSGARDGRAKKNDDPEALRIGLVNAVWPNDELLKRAQDPAAESAAMPALAVAKILHAVVGAGAQAVTDGGVAERKGVIATMGTKDQQEGMRAFLEKRKPVFNRD